MEFSAPKALTPHRSIEKGARTLARLGLTALSEASEGKLRDAKRDGAVARARRSIHWACRVGRVDRKNE